MTSINEEGQVYWTFEELDFEGAIRILRCEIIDLKAELLLAKHTVDKVRLNRRIVSRSMVINRIEMLKNWSEIHE